MSVGNEERPFEARVRVWNRSEEDDAKIPPRPPRLRDDDPWSYGSYDVTSDECFFRRHPSRQFRLISACASEIRHAGLFPLAEGMRAVRMSRRQVGPSQKVVFPWPNDGTQWLNSLSESSDALRREWEWALNLNEGRGVLPDGWWRA